MKLHCKYSQIMKSKSIGSYWISLTNKRLFSSETNHAAVMRWSSMMSSEGCHVCSAISSIISQHIVPWLREHRLPPLGFWSDRVLITFVQWMATFCLIRRAHWSILWIVWYIAVASWWITWVVWSIFLITIAII